MLTALAFLIYAVIGIGGLMLVIWFSGGLRWDRPMAFDKKQLDRIKEAEDERREAARKVLIETSKDRAGFITRWLARKYIAKSPY